MNNVCIYVRKSVYLCVLLVYFINRVVKFYEKVNDLLKLRRLKLEKVIL